MGDRLMGFNCISFFFQGDSLITICNYRSGEKMIRVSETRDISSFHTDNKYMYCYNNANMR